MMYNVYTRNWWKNNSGGKWPNGLEPNAGGRRHYLAWGIHTESEARQIAQEYNRTHEPGRLSRKAEFEES